MLITRTAQAYMNHGRWIADCPHHDCGNALALRPKETQFYCAPPSGCQTIAEVEWPPDAAEIDAALSVRPVPTTRNWAPAGHRQAVACRVPDGQSVKDLLQETHDHEERP